MYRTLGIEPSSRLALHGLRLTRDTYTAYRSWLVHKVCRNLLPVERYRVTTGYGSNVMMMNDGSYRIQFDNTKIKGVDLYEILDVQLGYLIHECAHVIYTDFQGQETTILKCQSLHKDIPLNIIHEFYNTVEDIRIESRMADEIPGSGNYLQATRLSVMYDMIEARRTDPESTGTIGLNTLVYCYYTARELYELWVDDPAMNEYGYKREDIERICEIPYLSEDTDRIVGELLDLLSEAERKDIKKYDMLNQFMQMMSQALGKALTEKLKSELKESNSAADKKSKRKSANENGAKSDKELKKLQTVDDKNVTNPDRDSDSAEREKHRKVSEGKLNELNSISEDKSDVEAEVAEDKSQMPECDDDISMMDYFPAEMNNETVDWKKVTWNQDDRTGYETIVRDVVGNSAAVLRAAFMKYNVGGWKTQSLLESGKPDRRFIHRAMMDDTRVFKQMEKRVNAPLDVVILIDESGSMSGSGKYKRAREVAILIHEALLGIKNINYWCYGHTTGGWSGNSTADVLMSIYHEGPVRDVQDKYKLMRIRADSGNCDGRAILESAGRVKRRISNDRNVLFILISDGAPTESCHGIRPDDYARSAAKYVQDKYKYNFIHVGIDCCNKTLYDISIDYTNPADLSRRIGEVVSSFITRNRSRL